MLVRKLLITTGITIMLFGILYAVIDAEILLLQDLAAKIGR
jgi:predicted secreted protein